MKPRDSYQRTNKNKLLSPSAKVFSDKMFGWVYPPKFLTAKVLCYTVTPVQLLYHVRDLLASACSYMRK